jgi:peptidoglycan/xylan/chitin deacetylase (PgdA/CDA1 family)
LVNCNTDALTSEVEVCKFELEDLLGREVTMFAYPKGRYSAKVMRSVEAAGYKGSRTAQMLATHLDFTPFEMPTTLQVYPHSSSTYLRNAIRAANYRGLCTYVTRFRQLKSWVEVGKGLFDMVLKDGGIWHLFGHSWEIGRLELWRELEEILDYVAKRQEIIYACNGDVTSLLREQNHVPKS